MFSRITLILILSACSVQSVWADLQVRRVHWGFTGSVVSERVNPLTVEVYNASPKPFDGKIEFHRKLGSLDTSLSTAVIAYISPGSSRIIQIPMAIESLAPIVEMKWEGGDYKIGEPRLKSNRDHVWIRSQEVTVNTPRLEALESTFFPSTLGLTDPLESVVISSIPRWDLSRQQTLLDWILSGGTLHLVIPSGLDELPRFSGVLSILNGAEATQKLGRGRIRRHQIKESEIDQAFVQREILGLSVEEVNSITIQRGVPRVDGSGLEVMQASELEGALTDYCVLESKVDFPRLIVFLICFCYLLVIFPGNYLLSRWVRGYLYVYLGLLAIVLGFSILIAWLGRRDIEEFTHVDSIGLARELGDGKVMLLSWHALFLVDGTSLELGVGDDGAGVIEPARNRESVPAQSDYSSSSRLQLEGAPYSTFPFLQIGKVSLPELPVRLVSQEGDSIEIELLDQFPETIEEAVAVRGNEFFRLERFGDRLRTVGLPNRTFYSLRYSYDRKENQEAKAFSWRMVEPGFELPPHLRIVPDLIARDLNLDLVPESQIWSLPEGKIRLYVLIEWPEEIVIKNGEESLPNLGYLMISKDL